MASASLSVSSPNLTLMYLIITSLALIESGYLLMQIPSPGAVCPAMVIYGLEIVNRLSRVIVPETLNTTIRGPSVSQASRKLPGPESFRFVTRITFPPLPPRVIAPYPSAPGNAGTVGVSAANPFGISERIPTHTRNWHPCRSTD